MCGVIGVYGHGYIAQDVYDGLVTLQHRGQDAAGIVTYDGQFRVRKDYGLVKDVFRTRHMRRLQGYAGVGHTRYATIGTGDIEEVQPYIGPSSYGVMLAHNGNLFNSAALKQEIFEKDQRLVNSDNDGEVLLNLFSKALAKQASIEYGPEHIWHAVESVYRRAQGAYAVVAYIAGQGMVAFRDPKGIRPLVMGKREDESGTRYLFASESVTLDILGYDMVGDVGAGEAVFIPERGRSIERKQIRDEEPTPCIFEHVYFARPDSVMDGVSVYEARLNMGKYLGETISRANLEVDVVMPIPDSGRTAAFTIADALAKPYREGLVKNRYIGRTFIMPETAGRKRSVRFKLNPIPREIKGKSILLVDDSIVRGNTSKQIIEMVRAAGAKRVYLVSVAPPVTHPNVYGIDIATRGELIAAQMSIAEIESEIGADKLFFGSIEDMKQSCIEADGERVRNFDMSCFDGVYPTGDVTSDILERQELARVAERKTESDNLTVRAYEAS